MAQAQEGNDALSTPSSPEEDAEQGFLEGKGLQSAGSEHPAQLMASHQTFWGLKTFPNQRRARGWTVLEKGAGMSWASAATGSRPANSCCAKQSQTGGVIQDIMGLPPWAPLLCEVCPKAFA